MKFDDQPNQNIEIIQENDDDLLLAITDYHHIKLLSNSTEYLIKHENILFPSLLDVLNNFKEITLEIKYPGTFKSSFNWILKTFNNKKFINISVFISEIDTALNFFKNNKKNQIYKTR